MHKTDELRTARIDTLVTPEELAQQLPVGLQVAENVTASRKRIEHILSGDDKRLLVIVGPARSMISMLPLITPSVYQQCVTNTKTAWKLSCGPILKNRAR